MDPPPPIFHDALGQPRLRGTALFNRHAQWSEWRILVNPQIDTGGNPELEARVVSLMEGALTRVFSNPARIATFMETVSVTGPGVFDAPELMTVRSDGELHIDPRGRRAESRETRERRGRPTRTRMPDVDWSDDRYDATHVFAQTWFPNYEIGGRKKRVHAVVVFRVLHDSAFRVNMDPTDPTSFPFVFSEAFNEEVAERTTREEGAEGYISLDEAADKYLREINALVPPYKPGVFAKVTRGGPLYPGAWEYDAKDTRARGRWSRRPGGDYGNKTFTDGAVRDTGGITFPPPPAGQPLPAEFPPAAAPDEYARQRFVRPAARK